MLSGRVQINRVASPLYPLSEYVEGMSVAYKIHVDNWVNY